MPEPVTFPDSHRDLLDIPVAVLATNGPDGQPQVSATWFLHDTDGKLKLSLDDSRQKVKNLRRDPRATLLLIDPGGYRTLEIRADVELLPDTDFSFAGHEGVKYGADIHGFDGPDTTRSIVVLHPKRVNTYG